MFTHLYLIIVFLLWFFLLHNYFTAKIVLDEVLFIALECVFDILQDGNSTLDVFLA